MTARNAIRKSNPCLSAFLADDFVRFGEPIIGRCRQIDGHRLYLTGATGFFGQNILALLSHLYELGARFAVTALSRCPERFVADHPWCQNLPWLEWHRGDASAPWPGNGDHDLLLHAATDTSAAAHSNKLDIFERIVEGTRQAVDFAGKNGVRRLLLTGSGAQYGVIPRGGISETSGNACDPTSSGSAYGEAKRVSELLAVLHSERLGFSVVSTRCFAFVGPGLALDGHFAIGNFIRDALGAGPIRLASAGDAVRSYLYSADLAVWLIALLLDSESNAAINVGSDVSIRVVDLADRVRVLLNPSIAVELGGHLLGGGRQNYVPSITAARRRGLEVWTDLERSISRTAEWHRLRDTP